MPNDTDDDWHPLDDAEPAEDLTPPVVRMLARKWLAEPRRMTEAFGGLYSFVRDGRTALAIAAVVHTDKSWADLTRDGVSVPEHAWRAASIICGATQIPFFAVVDAADDVRFMKVGSFGPAGGPPLRFAAPLFRPV